MFLQHSIRAFSRLKWFESVVMSTMLKKKNKFKSYLKYQFSLKIKLSRQSREKASGGVINWADTSIKCFAFKTFSFSVKCSLPISG